MRRLLGLATALVVATSVGHGQSPTLIVNGSLNVAQIPVGSTLAAQVSGPTGLDWYWFFDPFPGISVVNGVTVPLAFSPAAFEIVGGTPFPSTGLSVSVTVPADPALVGTSLNSLAAWIDPNAPAGFLVSNLVSLSFLPPGTSPLARNPQPPDATFVLTRTSGPPGVSCLNTAPLTSQLFAPASCGPNTQAPVVHGAAVTGNVTLSPHPLVGTIHVGAVRDAEIGHFLLTAVSPGNTTNTMANPGRGSLVPGVPDVQNGTTLCGLRNVLGVNSTLSPPLQPLGNFLYLIDETAGEVRIFNSYDFTPIGTLSGIVSPGGLGMSPDLTYLYVSSSTAQGAVHRIHANPTSPHFHMLDATVDVGAFPRAISVQPGNEDVFVVNSGDNSFSVIDSPTHTERVRMVDPQAQGPRDIFITHRMTGPGLTNEYFAYITNEFSDNVTVYGSDSPVAWSTPPEGRLWTTQTGFQRPTHGCWNWRTYITLTSEPGCFIANSAGTTVDELTMFNFLLEAPPGFPSPPPRRDHHILKSYASQQVGNNLGSPSDVSIDNHSGLFNSLVIGLTDDKGVCDPSIGNGVPSVVLVSYPAAGIVASFNAAAPQAIASASVPGCDFLQSFYDQ